MFRIACMTIALGFWFLSGSAYAQDAARGRQAYVDSKCSVCHLIGDEGNKKGAALDEAVAKLTAEQIRGWITNAPEMAAKANITRKPPMKAYTDFPRQKVDDLVAYLTSLKK